MLFKSLVATNSFSCLKYVARLDTRCYSTTSPLLCSYDTTYRLVSPESLISRYKYSCFPFSLSILRQPFVTNFFYRKAWTVPKSCLDIIQTNTQTMEPTTEQTVDIYFHLWIKPQGCNKTMGNHGIRQIRSLLCKQRVLDSTGGHWTVLSLMSEHVRSL